MNKLETDKLVRWIELIRAGCWRPYSEGEGLSDVTRAHYKGMFDAYTQVLIAIDHRSNDIPNLETKEE